MKYRKVIFVIFAGLFVFTAAQSHIWSGEPTELVREVILKKISHDKTENIQNDKTMLWEDISPSFDFREISKRVMGQHWENLLDEERNEFEVLFTNHIKRSYVRITNPLFGNKIISIKERMTSKFAKVQTELLTRTDKDVSADFYLFNRKGEWKIYDLVIEGVSLVNNYRSQIHSTMSNGSFRELVEIMKQNQDNEYGVPEHRLLASGSSSRHVK